MYIVRITSTILFPQYCFLVLTKAAGNITAEANEANRVEAIKFYSVSKVMNYTIGTVRVYQLSPGLRPSAATSALRECYRPAPSAIESPIAGDRDRERRRNFHHIIPANAYSREEATDNWIK